MCWTGSVWNFKPGALAGAVSVHHPWNGMMSKGWNWLSSVVGKPNLVDGFNAGSSVVEKEIKKIVGNWSCILTDKGEKRNKYANEMG